MQSKRPKLEWFQRGLVLLKRTPPPIRPFDNGSVDLTESRRSFGNKTVRANMHAGNKWDDAIGEAGPEDPDLSIIAFQTLDGQPLAVSRIFPCTILAIDSSAADYFGFSPKD